MDIDLHEITIRDLFDGFTEDDANGIVMGDTFRKKGNKKEAHRSEPLLLRFYAV